MRFAAMIVGAALALSACASDAGLREEQKLGLYRSHAGPPVPSFQYFGRIDGWTPLGDSAVAIWTKPNQAYLLELSGPCSDLDFTPFISLTNQSGRVYARFDKVIARGHNAIEFPCTISEIRTLDVKAIRQAEKTARDQPPPAGT